jgi:chitinase
MKLLKVFAFIFLLNCQNAFSQFKVIGYLPTWGGNLNDVQYTKLTHINYCFLIPNTDGTYQAPDDPARLNNLVALAHANGVKVMISVGGGGGGDAFKSIVTTSNLRTTFVNNMIAFAKQYNIDGIDIDWEFPANGTEANNFLLMMQELYTATHNNNLLCTIAVVAYGGASILNGVFSAVDFLNIMAYDENSYEHSTYDLGVQSVNYWIGRGLPANKAVLGVPFYGRDNCCAYKTAGYNEILGWGGSAQSDTYNNSIGYNGIPTMKKKTEYAIGACGGIMIWSIDTDVKGANSLLSAINDVVLANNASFCGNVSSSADDGNVAANVLDKNLNTRWSASGDGQWIKFCLGRDSIPVNTIHVAFYNGNVRTSNFDVEVSHDGTTWTKALTNAVSSGTSLALETFTFPLQYTRFLRLLGHGNSANAFNSYTEIGIDSAHVSYTSTSIPGIIQAENYDLGGEGLAYHDASGSDEGSGFRTNSAVDVQACTDAGGAYNVGWTTDGEWLNYTVNVTVGGTYNIALRSASLNTAGAVQFYLDNVAATSTINLPITGGYQTWQTTNATTTLALTPGLHTIKLNITTSGFNLNYMDFQSAVATGLTELSETLSVYPNPAVDEVRISGIKGNSELTLMDAMGEVVLRQSTTNSNENISLSAFSAGIYFLKISSNNNIQTVKIVLQ